MVTVRQRHRRHDGAERRSDRNRDHQTRWHRRACAGYSRRHAQSGLHGWSPDNQRVACEGWDETTLSREGIYTVRSSDGGGLVRLTKTPANLVDLPGDYSPDGTLFLFKRSADEVPGPLMVVPTAGGRPPLALTDLAVEDPGRYSPDGKTILTSSNGRIVLLSADTGREIGQLEQPGTSLFGPVWSPDGGHIAYSGATSGPYADIYTSLPDGTDQRRVTSTAENEIRVEWGKD